MYSLWVVQTCYGAKVFAKLGVALLSVRLRASRGVDVYVVSIKNALWGFPAQVER